MAYSHVRASFKIGSQWGDSCTEAFYLPSAALGTIDPDTGPVVWARSFVSKRVLCMSESWFIRSFRISAAPIPGGAEFAPRLSLNVLVDPNVGRGKVALRPDVPATVLLANLRTTTGHNRQYDIHGVADDAVTMQFGGGPTLGVSPSVQAYLDWLTTSGAQLKVRLVPASAATLPKVSSITVGAGGSVTFAGVLGLGAVPAGAHVLVSGAKGWKAGQFNAEWVVVAYDNVTGDIIASTKRLIDPNIFYVKNSASVRGVNPALIGFDALAGYDKNVVRPASHKVGNALDGRRGRRSAKR